MLPGSSHVDYMVSFHAGGVCVVVKSGTSVRPFGLVTVHRDTVHSFAFWQLVQVGTARPSTFANAS